MGIMIIISDLASLVAAATHSQQYCSFPPVNMPRPWIDCIINLLPNTVADSPIAKTKNGMLRAS
jgi:hypothetical protein